MLSCAKGFLLYDRPGTCKSFLEGMPLILLTIIRDVNTIVYHYVCIISEHQAFMSLLVKFQQKKIHKKKFAKNEVILEV